MNVEQISLLIIILISSSVFEKTSSTGFSVISTTQRSIEKDIVVSIFQKQVEHVAKTEECNRKMATIGLQTSQILKLLEDQKKNDELNEVSQQIRVRDQKIKEIEGTLKSLRQRLEGAEREIESHKTILRVKNQEVEVMKEMLKHFSKKNSQKLETNDQQLLQQNINGNFSANLSDNLTDCKSASGHKFPKNCKEVMDKGHYTSGVYVIQPKSECLTVLCDMETKGGGWTVIHKRFDGSQNFDLNWTDYEKGFGSVEGEFWLGLEHIHSLTAQNYTELLVELVDQDKHEAQAFYDTFRVSSLDEGYKLKLLSGYEGNAGDSLMNHLHERFSTQDRGVSNCASKHGGGWWFYYCETSNLNGRYLRGSAARKADRYGRGINWYTFTTDNKSLLKAKMMVRPRDDT